MAQDPDGGPYPAFPSGNSWDEASSKTGSRKKSYHNVISGADFEAQPCHVDCVVFVRVARGARIRYTLCDSTKAISLATLAGGENVRGVEQWPSHRLKRWQRGVDWTSRHSVVALRP